MRRRKNPALPEHLRTVEAALDWALSGQANADLYGVEGLDGFYIDGFPNEVKSYQDAVDFVGEYFDANEFYGRLNEVERISLERGPDYELTPEQREAYNFFNIKTVRRVVELAEMYIDRMLSAEESDEVVLYRALSVPNIDAIKFQEIGVYWAYDPGGAQTYWHRDDAGATYIKYRNPDTGKWEIL